MQQTELSSNKPNTAVATQPTPAPKLYPLMEAVGSISTDALKAALPFLTAYEIPVYVRPPHGQRIIVSAPSTKPGIAQRGGWEVQAIEPASSFPFILLPPDVLELRSIVLARKSLDTKRGRCRHPWSAPYFVSTDAR